MVSTSGVHICKVRIARSICSPSCARICVCVYVCCVHTCIRVDSLLEARLQEGPLEVDNDIQAVLKEVWPHVAC